MAMKCKTCQDKGMMLKSKQVSEHEIVMEVVGCDCCGGWSVDGYDCENCKQGRRVIEWLEEENE
jgi:hypothetical protein